MTEEEELKAKIARLSGQIKRHKTGDTVESYVGSEYPSQAYEYGGINDAPQHYTPPVDSIQGYQPSPRGNYRGSRGRARGGRTHGLHRNNTLVLNASSAAPALDEQAQPAGLISTAPAFVSKTGRHRQLINTSIYDKETEKRVKAMEITRLERLKRKDEREKLKFHKRLQNSRGSSYSGPSNDIITIQGIQFRLTKNGSKLAKVSGDQNAAKDTPKAAVIQGVKFYRSRSGNMYRYAFIKAHRKPGLVKKIDELCKIFNTTGSCLKGPRCRYIHDPQKVAACREFLQKGLCPSGDSCDLSHELTPERTPTCLHFSKGNCSNADCRYTHIRVSSTALVCRSFGIYGYCEKGTGCTERHVNECPDFSNTGSCPTKGCKLLHRSKASVMRNNPAPSAATDDSDFSSDEDEDEIGSDDVDSDALEELFDDDDGERDEDIPMQHDFVQLK